MPLAPDVEKELIRIVREAAKTEIMTRFRVMPDSAVHAKSAPDDLVTDADMHAEVHITHAVRSILPDALVIGEEAVSNRPTILGGLATENHAVIIDPIDGTWNFAKGLTTFGVILAVTEKGETVFGLLYDPVIDDWIVARKGGGTWYCRPGFDPLRLRISGDAPMEQTLGFVPLFMFP